MGNGVWPHRPHIWIWNCEVSSRKNSMELNEQIFWATALNILKFGGARDDTGYQGCTQASLLQRGWLPPFWTKYLLIWIHYYTVSLLSLQIILNDLYIQRRREMFCMISRHLSWKGDTFCYPVSCRCNLLWINPKLYRSSIKGCRPWPYPAFARQNTFEAVSRQRSLE